MPQTKPFLSVRSLSHTYHTNSGETPALRDIHFDLFPGEFAAIVGPSGCGKSTLLELIARLIPIETGSLLYPACNKTPAIGYMLQKDHLFEWRTIYSNMLLGLEIQKRITPKSKERVDNLLENYGLDKFKGSRPSQLSGGMRQRAALIRTLALEPDLLLLDEPFSALDYQTRLSVSDDIGTIIRQEGKTAILVTHDISEAVSMADRVLVFSKRPATVQKIIPVEFEMENRTPMACRNAPEFKKYFNEIWKELNLHV